MSTQRRDFTTTTHATSYPYISPISLNLTGRHVLITGAAHADGVGYAAATAFARAGASVLALADIAPTSPDLIAGLKAAAVEAGRAEPVVVADEVDIARLESTERLRETIGPALEGRLDVLINNAGFQEPYHTLLTSTPETYWRTWEVNVHGLFNTTRTFLPLLLSTPQDSLKTVLNVSSSGALSVRPGSASYRTSKLAVLRWTEALHVEHSGSDGLLAISVNPGAIRTRITVNEPEAVRERLPHKPEVAGDTIAWLAAGRREWLGGRYVSCPWDMEELVERREEIVEGDKLKVRMVF